MRSKVAAASAALAALALGAAVASAAKVDFSGTWVMDAAKSEGLPPGVKQTLKVTQKDDKIDIEVKVTQPDGTERTLTDSYTADGKETPFQPVMQGGGPPPKNAKRTAKWAADRSGIDVIENSEVDTPEGPDTLQMVRKWTLSADGKTLTIEQNFKGPIGSQQSKRVFTKQ